MMRKPPLGEWISCCTQLSEVSSNDYWANYKDQPAESHKNGGLGGWGGGESPRFQKNRFGTIVIFPDDYNGYSDSCIPWNINLKVTTAYIKHRKI